MKREGILKILFVAGCLAVWPVHLAMAGPVGTSFTYQGRLLDANQTADGLYDFQFKLFDAASDGNQLGLDVNTPEVGLIDGYFTIELDFGSVFDGNERWLEISIRPGGQNDPNVYTALSPRQKVTPAPYAIYAKNGGGGGGALEPTTPIIWSGGCSHHGTAAGWNTYCNDRVDFNTAAAYISANGSGTFTFLKSGYYRINFWCISTMADITDIKFLKNGSHFIYTMDSPNNRWIDNIADQIWPFNASDSLQIQVYNSGGGSSNYAYHSWSPSGEHSRVQISYEGPLN